jgi:Family of unknown function (DUF6011)
MVMHAKPCDDLNDDLSDLLGSGSAEPKPLPQDDASVRIRATTPVFEERCRKCGGSGRFGTYRDLGPCHACKGKGKRTFATSPETRAANRASAERRAAKAATSKLDAFKAAHPDHWKWIETTAATPITDRNAGFIGMVQELPGRIAKWGDLHEGTMAMIERGMARDAERAAAAVTAQAEAVKRSVEVSTAKIEEAFARRQAAGQIRLGLHYDGLFIGPYYGQPGVLRVKASKAWESTYYGKIEAGRFYPTRACPEEIKERLAVIAADPAAAARVSGKDTGICCCCGRVLTDPVSIANGIGPICAGAWGF